MSFRINVCYDHGQLQRHLEPIIDTQHITDVPFGRRVFIITLALVFLLSAQLSMGCCASGISPPALDVIPSYDELVSHSMPPCHEDVPLSDHHVPAPQAVTLYENLGQSTLIPVESKHFSTSHCEHIQCDTQGCGLGVVIPSLALTTPLVVALIPMFQDDLSIPRQIAATVFRPPISA